jgi:hypothetical protein
VGQVVEADKVTGVSEIQRQTFLLRPDPPVRALAIASLGAVVGAVLIVLAASLDLHGAVTMLGLAVLGAALALAVTGLVLTARLKSTVILDQAGLSFRRGSRQHTLGWGAIRAVELTDSSIVIRARDDADVELANPRGATDRVVRALLTAVRNALDTDRGYSSRQGSKR